ncbi:MAG: helix-turn-helix transcriptional regulator [Pirellulaceae bacterium]
MTTLTRSQDNAQEFSTFKLAIAVLAERLASLPKADKEDLFDLTKILFSAECDEERQSAMRAMDEIMEQRPLALVNPVPIGEVTEPLQNWLDFISKRIRDARVAAGLNQTALADKAGLTQSHISRLENGDHSPSQATIRKIAAALGMEASELDPSAE